MNPAQITEAPVAGIAGSPVVAGMPAVEGIPAAGDGAARGGYVLAEAHDADLAAAAPDVVLVAAGGEVPAALGARRILQREGIATRVVSMPCAAWFHRQSSAYRDAVLPPSAPATVSVGAGAEVGRYQLLGGAGENVCLDHFDTGTGTPGIGLYGPHDLSPERVAAAARASLSRTTGRGRP
ncbi:transketolase-like TK C-terminal-containing protein [Streptomyces sp. URMC 124]|uniref:transketolase-like TK C-terminal-containing protein n=1 Tax=Streptomyces sp. URMC 124 TaxID=3423405 RepID=UPI003F19B391